MIYINKGIKFLANILNRNISRVLTIIRIFTRNRFRSIFFADKISIKVNRLIGNEYIPNPYECLHITTVNICNLNCRICAYSKTSRNKTIMSNDVFFKILNQATNFGFDIFNLTPMNGEVFVDKHFIEKLEILENHPKVKSYSFFTNFTLANDDIIEWLINAKKLDELYISIYGHDLDSFLKISRANEKIYNNLVSNLKYLLKRCKDIKFNLSFNFRTYLSIKTLKDCNSKLCQIVKTIKKSRIKILHNYDSWIGYISQNDVNGLDIKIGNASEVYRNGACTILFYNNRVFVDGIVNACACRDIYAILRIGDLKTQTFEEIYSKKNKVYMNLIDNQQMGKFNPICKNCGFYRSIYKNYEIYENHKKKCINLRNFYRFLTNC